MIYESVGREQLLPGTSNVNYLVTVNFLVISVHVNHHKKNKILRIRAKCFRILTLCVDNLELDNNFL